MILDMCCGSRMFWFKKKDPNTVYMDIRAGVVKLPDRKVYVRPDIIGDFRALPFAGATFDMVVFDPPHLLRAGPKSWLRAKYGVLNPDSWRQDLISGFYEAFRVLKPGGFLMFKWNDDQIPVAEVVALTKFEPLYGSRLGKGNKTHWLMFRKDQIRRKTRD